MRRKCARLKCVGGGPSFNPSVGNPNNYQFLACEIDSTTLALSCVVPGTDPGAGFNVQNDGGGSYTLFFGDANYTPDMLGVVPPQGS